MKKSTFLDTLLGNDNYQLLYDHIQKNELLILNMVLSQYRSLFSLEELNKLINDGGAWNSIERLQFFGVAPFQFSEREARGVDREYITNDKCSPKHTSNFIGSSYYCYFSSYI